ncbi:perlucin-like protein [Triplophysa dalaica]|uniref:perlucin-like protein n=1 Tax=Triplophysa dalaica TaxID=1582913 RepID=UPI0024DFFD8F|nr:perlucin-like protein [Triplophysa dalaica]
MQNMHENIYCNTVLKTTSRPSNKNSFSKERGGTVVLFVALFLSSVANAVLVYLHYRDGCEPVTNCTDPVLHEALDDEHNAQNIWIHPKDNKDWTAAHNCPEKNFAEVWFKGKGRFYVFSTDAKNWNSSRERCQALGGDLVIINSKEEQEYVAGLILNTTTKALYWIGLSDSHDEGKWRWVDDTHLTHRFWASDPDNYTSPEYPEGEDCVILNGRITEAKWGDVSCLRKERGICEILCA